MICWGSWANTMKLTGRNWFFQLYYWDYSLGVLIFSLLLAFTLGSHGTGGRPFLEDLSQADSKNLGYAFLAGTIFNLSNV
jgi:glucose uptake protein